MKVNLMKKECEMEVVSLSAGVPAQVRAQVTINGQPDEVFVLYISEGRPAEISPYDARRFGVTYAENLLDEKTMGRINRHFNKVFALPAEQRDAYFKRWVTI